MLSKRLKYQLIMSVATLFLAIAVVATFVVYTLHRMDQGSTDVGFEDIGCLLYTSPSPRDLN